MRFRTGWGRRPGRALVAVAAVVVVAAGCSGDGSAGPTSVLDEPGPVPGGPYDTLTELRDAYMAAGGDCPAWEVIGPGAYADAMGHCDRDTTLMMFDTPVDSGAITAQVHTLITLAGSSLLVGDNWVINDDKFVLDEVQVFLGGAQQGPDDYPSEFEAESDVGSNMLSPEVIEWYGECFEGDMAACDALYAFAPEGSEEEMFGHTCGNRQPEGDYTYCFERHGDYVED